MPYPTMSWVVPLSEGRLYIGPPPTKDIHVGFLIQENRVSLFVNLAPLKPHETQETYERDFSDRIDRVLEKTGMQERHSARIFDAQFNPAAYKPVGRDEKAKRADMAAFYVRHAEKIWKGINKDDIVYIHGARGDLEEVFIGLALVHFMGNPTKVNDPCKWISEHNYDHLLNDDNENKMLLQAVWDEVKRLNRARAFFPLKKQKKNI